MISYNPWNLSSVTSRATSATLAALLVRVSASSWDSSFSSSRSLDMSESRADWKNEIHRSRDRDTRRRDAAADSVGGADEDERMRGLGIGGFLSIYWSLVSLSKS